MSIKLFAAKMRTNIRRVLRTIYSVGLLMSPICAIAGLLGDRLTPYVSASSTYDSNLLRLSGDEQILFGNSQRWDILVRTEVGLVADVPIERQQFFADVNVNFNQYQEYTFLDYTGGQAKLWWDWQIGEHWSGRVGYEFRRFLTSFNNFRSPVKDLTDIQTAYGEFGYQFHPSWEVVGGIRFSDLTHSSQNRRISDQRILTYEGELRHRNAAGNYLGIELVVRDGEFPNRTAAQINRTNRDYIQYRTGLTVKWRPTGKSTVDGRFGYTIHENDTDSARDFGRMTWRLDYRWKATGKTRVKLSTWRAIRPVDDPVASFVEDTGVSLSPLWEPTAKISVRGELSYINQDYSGSSATVGAVVDRLEDIYTATFGVGYRPVRQVLFEIVYDYQNRSSTRAFFDYFYHTVNGVVRIDF